MRMRKGGQSPLEWDPDTMVVLPMLTVRRRIACTATMTIIRTRALLTASTGLNGSPAVSSLALARGIAASTVAVDSMEAVDSWAAIMIAMAVADSIAAFKAAADLIEVL